MADLFGDWVPDISIHAPRTGSDEFDPTFYRYKLISIHAPRTGSDERGGSVLVSPKTFQSTLPARGATPHKPGGRAATTHFNPRSPHGERLPVAAHQRVALLISIHAPRTGSDLVALQDGDAGGISIHAPRTGSDDTDDLRGIETSTISIHAPRTGSDRHGDGARVPRHISIHAPRTGSDTISLLFCACATISIHAPRTGSDNVCPAKPRAFCVFQSTLPARGATTYEVKPELDHYISIHAPRTGSDHDTTFFGVCPTSFQSTLPARGATAFGAVDRPAE